MPFDSSFRRSSDFWDIAPTVDGRWAISLGDTAGFGSEAATQSERLASFARALVRAGYHGADVVRHLDARATALRLVSTMVHVLVDPVISRVEVWRAGHPPPLVSSDGCAGFLDGASAPPLGAAAGHLARSSWGLER